MRLVEGHCVSMVLGHDTDSHSTLSRIYRRITKKRFTQTKGYQRENAAVILKWDLNYDNLARFDVRDPLRAQSQSFLSSEDHVVVSKTKHGSWTKFCVTKSPSSISNPRQSFTADIPSFDTSNLP